MKRLARSTVTVALAGGLVLAPLPVPAAYAADSDAVTRNVPYGAIAQDGATAARTTARSRQLTAAGRMPYFTVVGAGADTSMDDTMVSGAQPAASAGAGVPTSASLADTNVDGGSSISIGAWLLGGAAVVLVLLALMMALQPRWRTERAQRAERDRRRVR